MTILHAMLLDAYRELNAKKLFWVVLAISGLVVLVYASVGFNESGFFLFFGLWQIDSEFVYAGSPLATLIYRTIFSSFIVEIWLAWVATILALVSTATIFPDFMASGTIDLVLSKPIRRSTLFFYKYLTGLLFMLLQVTAFCIGVFICMGWRIEEWNWIVFLAIPIVTFFYSILFSVCVLLGTLTRSALASLLLTMLFWFGLFSINTTEGIMNQIRIQFEMEEENEALDKLNAFYQPIKYIQAAMPKTSETIGLLDRWLKRPDEPSFTDLLSGNIERNAQGEFVTTRRSQSEEVQIKLVEDYESRSMWHILGTSFIFEVIVLGLGCYVFVRRDY